MNGEFLLRFEEFLGRSGWPTIPSPWDIVERWERLVDVCANCYQWGFYEFDDEVRVRALLERAFSDSRLIEYRQLQEMRQRVEAADKRFRELLSKQSIRDEQAPWWQRAVLARAGDEYRDDMRRLYGVEVMPC
jgi:hypothetical protein